MKIKVRYFSKSGNTRKIAEAIAERSETTEKTIDEPVLLPADLLFLGCAVYGFDIHEKIKAFISTLDNRVKRVALFSTSAFSKKALFIMRNLLTERGVHVMPQEFYCKGRFKIFSRKHPNNNDLVQAKEFAESVLLSIANTHVHHKKKQ